MEFSMSEQHRFDYPDLDALLAHAEKLGVQLPTSDNLSRLGEPVPFGRLRMPNRFAVQPMEGCDCSSEGAPSELTIRKYERFAAGGVGMIWWEACAVVPKGRANPRQLWLHEGSADAFAVMVHHTRRAAAEQADTKPLLVLQLTHSGRYSRPINRPAPIIAHHNPILDPRHNLPADFPLITDAELESLQDAYVEAAKLAAQVGFDAVDIKSCHRYLLSELLACHTRENSRFGGSFENRTRMLRETTEKVIDAVGDRIEVSTRLNCYDAIEHPYGFAVDPDDVNRPDLAEPIELIGQLLGAGMPGVNVSIGNPYFNPHVNRPADWSIINWPDFPEHPLVGVGRIIDVARQIQQAHPDATIVGSGYSWLRHFLPKIAAGLVEQGAVSVIGVGRGALAYPDFVKDILNNGAMSPLKVCMTCSSCTQIMRDGGTSGCVIRDPEVYEPIYKQGRHRDPERLREMAEACRQCADPTCVSACPAGINIPEFLHAAAGGDFHEAYRVLRRSNLLPEICGAVCPVEVQCQGNCIRQYLSDEGAVQIAEIQRWVSRMAIDQGWAQLDTSAEPTGREVAVIGAGPAGMSAAARLLELGHQVTVIERAGRPGGKVHSVIPHTRMPTEEAELELHAIFDPVGTDRLRWRFHTALGPDYDLHDILNEGHDAVLLAFGLGNTTGLADEAGRPERVIDALGFLNHMNRNSDHRVGGRIAVIGGGNTAVDAATMAARRGATDVYLIYRRSYSEMPAWPGERDEALHAGVHLLPFVQPLDFTVDGAGRATGLNLRRTELGEPDGDGRRRPVEQPDSDFEMAFDLIIEAMGESVPQAVRDVLHGIELDRGGRVSVGPDFATSVPGVYAAGDLVNGGATVVRAISEGCKAAEAMHAYITRTATVGVDGNDGV
jgi:NADPH-dependent glutamate synthase beta subunit-like oxidoreductase/2,4-dienoyl-CoA reductase-like NADH-dependent reductase (Old Yellow Enzyme family)